MCSLLGILKYPSKGVLQIFLPTSKVWECLFPYLANHFLTIFSVFVEYLVMSPLSFLMVSNCVFSFVYHLVIGLSILLTSKNFVLLVFFIAFLFPISLISVRLFSSNYFLFVTLPFLATLNRSCSHWFETFFN